MVIIIKQLFLSNTHDLARRKLDTCLMRSSKESTFCFFMTERIILAPISPIFIFDSASFFEPLGIIVPNIFETIFFFTLTFSFLRMILRQQNVKNLSTLMPIAAAPLAMMNEAIALSRLPLKTIIVFSFKVCVTS